MYKLLYNYIHYGPLLNKTLFTYNHIIKWLKENDNYV